MEAIEKEVHDYMVVVLKRLELALKRERRLKAKKLRAISINEKRHAKKYQ